MKISEAKLRRMVRTMAEQMDRTSYRPSWEDETSTLERDIGMPVGGAENFKIQGEEFIDAIREGMGFIEDWDIKRQWDNMFDDDIKSGQLRQLENWLENENLLESGPVDEDADEWGY